MYFLEANPIYFGTTSCDMSCRYKLRPCESVFVERDGSTLVGYELFKIFNLPH